MQSKSHKFTCPVHGSILCGSPRRKKERREGRLGGATGGEGEEGDDHQSRLKQLTPTGVPVQDRPLMVVVEGPLPSSVVSYPNLCCY